MSQTAVTRAAACFVIRSATYVPRPPDPSRPILSDEFAALPLTAANGTISALRLVMIYFISPDTLRSVSCSTSS